MNDITSYKLQLVKVNTDEQIIDKYANIYSDGYVIINNDRFYKKSKEWYSDSMCVDIDELKQIVDKINELNNKVEG